MGSAATRLRGITCRQKGSAASAAGCVKVAKRQAMSTAAWRSVFLREGDGTQFMGGSRKRDVRDEEIRRDGSKGGWGAPSADSGEKRARCAGKGGFWTLCRFWAPLLALRAQGGPRGGSFSGKRGAFWANDLGRAAILVYAAAALNA